MLLSALIFEFKFLKFDTKAWNSGDVWLKQDFVPTEFQFKYYRFIKRQINLNYHGKVILKE